MKKLITTVVLGMVGIAIAMEPGQYENSYKEKLLVFNTGELVLTQKRQVGSPSVFSGAATVPYPTVCTFVEYAVIKSEDHSRLSYDVKSAQLIQPGEPKENCAIWIAEHNGRIVSGRGAYSLKKEEFKKVD